jgi:hypothetical protein
MTINGMQHRFLLACLAFAGAMAPAWAATGTISANPNPCVVPPGAPHCVTNVTWATDGARGVRVYARAQKEGAPEREFAKEPSCAQCVADWIEPGTTYVFTLVDFSEGRRGAILANVTVTGVAGQGGISGAIRAEPNPCRIEPGRDHCTAHIFWSSTGADARVFVRSEGPKGFAEKEFGRGRTGDRVEANWIEERTRYFFTLVDFSTGGRGQRLASVEVTAIR